MSASRLNLKTTIGYPLDRLRRSGRGWTAIVDRLQHSSFRLKIPVMCPREVVSEHALLFGENSLYEVLFAIASRGGDPFHGASIARQVSRTDAQVQVEIGKLSRLGVLDAVSTRGRARPWVVKARPLAEAVLSLPRLLEDELGAYSRAINPANSSA